MKKLSFLVALLFSVTGFSQSFNVHKTDGTIVSFSMAEVDYIDFTYKSYLACPDTNHPHSIDLGLPFGTQWACCNVGASAPEQYGGYYAWGETHEKSGYNWDTYQYGSSWDNVVNIGSDIAGTGYDAATANWGAPWRMPS